MQFSSYAIMDTNDDFPVEEGYRCGFCGETFHHPSLIYTCDVGHIFCQKCFQHSDTAKNLICPRRICKAPIFRMDSVNRFNDKTSGEDVANKRKKMFPDPQTIAENITKRRLEKKSFFSLFKGDTLSSQNLSSRRPINCPYPDCQKSIALSSLGHHFKCEHKTVALISTYYENRNGLEFNPCDIKYNEKLCIVLISIIDGSGGVTYASETDSFISLRLPPDSTTLKPVMLVMATRIPFHQLYQSGDSNDECEDNCEEDDKTRERKMMNQKSSQTDKYNYPPADKILLWVASNQPMDGKYTLALSTPSKCLRMKYYGSIVPMSSSPIKLCEGGKGLILNHAQAVGMTNNGKKSVMLDIVLHKNQEEELEILNLNS